MFHETRSNAGVPTSKLVIANETATSYLQLSYYAVFAYGMEIVGSGNYDSMLLMSLVLD